MISRAPTLPTPAILVIDDDPEMCIQLDFHLRREGYLPTCQTSPLAALRALEQAHFAAVVTDVEMGELSGIELCRRVVAQHPDLPVVVLTAHREAECVVAAFRAGAKDLVLKPLVSGNLCEALGRSLAAVPENARKKPVSHDKKPPELLGESEAMRQVLSKIAQLAPLECSVLVSGESGTGKDLVAQNIHRGSPRNKKPFVAINCAAVPESLLETELFGHTKGAFTGANSNHAGLFQQANHGTLFLDEIGDLPLTLQPKLLRVLEQKTIRPVGAEREISVDVRIVAATHRNLSALVKQRLFREDLFYRLSVLNIALPPLRERGGDVLLLANRLVEYFAHEFNRNLRGIGPDAAQILLSYAWPGNVRELRNCIEHAAVFARDSQISAQDLPDTFGALVASAEGRRREDPTLLTKEAQLPLEEIEKLHIQSVLAAVGGNKTQAAAILGVDRKTLYRRLQQMEKGKK